MMQFASRSSLNLGVSGTVCVQKVLHRLKLSRTAAFHARSSVDSEEIERFGKLSSEWLSEDSSFKALYSYNKLRVPWITETLSKGRLDEKPLHGKRILDVACGGGILSIPLARLGASVSGIDASQDAVNCAARAAECFLKKHDSFGIASFYCSSVEEYALKNSKSFDAVIASEVIEHVSDLEEFLRCCAILAKPGAPLFFTTINKTVWSRIFAVYLAEEVFKVVSSGVHDWSKFVEPSTLRVILEKNGCNIRFIHGTTYNPLTNSWSWSSNTSINYAMMAVKL